LKLEEIPNPGDHIALPPEVIFFSDFFSSKIDLNTINMYIYFLLSYYNFRSLNALPAFRLRKMQLKN
jgi:hypothetical protein